MKKFFVMMLSVFLVLSFLTACSQKIDVKTAVKQINFLHCFSSGTEVLVLEVDEGTLLVWSPKEDLKKFLSQVKPGDNILLEASEEKSSDDLFSDHTVRSRFHVIRRIVKLPEGNKYKR